MNGEVDAPADRLDRILPAVFALGALAAGGLILAGPRHPAVTPSKPAKAAHHKPAVPPPPVEPLELKAVSRTDAVAINAAVPFSTAPNPAAAPFHFVGSADSLARSIDCLAAAMIYEAGGADAEGQRAVAQVVLNRVRHPAYPKTVCQVVFQGSERTTGCQFTFTCDGALRRTAPEAAWEGARRRAAEALDGHVYAPVGHATHYHTDWVVPYWSASLDKITAVGTHLFFRWHGFWGTPGAYRTPAGIDEPAIAKLAAYSPVHRAAEALATASGTSIADYAMIPASKPRETRQQDGDTFILTLDRAASADSHASLAIATCGDRPYCKVMGWTDAGAVPRTPADAERARASMSFSFLRNRDAGFEKPLWNCAQFKRADQRQCMKAPATVSAGEQPSRRRPGRGDDGAFTSQISSGLLPKP